MSANNDLKISTWNARSVKNKKHEVINFIEKHNIDILLITETFLKPHIAFHIPNFLIYRNDRLNQTGGGVAIIIKNSINHNILPILQLQTIENISIMVPTANFLLKISCCYAANSNHLNFRSDISRLANSNLPYILGGDFNSRHPFWNCSRSNKGGRTLYNLLNSHSNCVIHFPDSPTYHQSNRNSSTLDFFFGLPILPY